MKEFTEPRELLPDWGPYSKKYMGISKIVGKAPIPGARFDCVVHPMRANTNQPAPNVTFPSSYHVWEAAPDLSYYAYRVELEWKDQVYADVSFSKVDEHTRLIRTKYVNQTEMDQNCVLNYYLAMEYPWKQMAVPECNGAFSWKNVVDYDSLSYGQARPWEHLRPDGLHRGEFFDSSFAGGRGFGERANCNPRLQREDLSFGKGKGDRVTFSMEASENFDQLTFRYRTTGMEKASFAVTIENPESGRSSNYHMEFPATDQLALISIPMETVETGKLTVSLVSEGKGGIELDFAALSYRGTSITVKTVQPEFKPHCTRLGAGYGLEYEGVEEKFGFYPLTDNGRIREIFTGTLEDALVSRLSQGDPTFDHVTETFTSAFTEKHSDDGFYQNFIVHSIFIPAGETHIEYAVIGDGQQKEMTKEEAEAVYEKARQALKPLNLNPDGQTYQFSNRILQATLLTNVVYPIYRHGTWIKHHPPGKRWDCLYTWDSGFIGLGLLEVEPKLAEYVLDLYLSQPDNQDFAFLMHGSPVPVQAYLYLELLQRAEDKEKLLDGYPRLRRYYMFLAGKTEGSATDPFNSRLTTTFDYFYNCSGMDDLPPQVAMYAENRQKDCAPALTTSQLIRMAKILKMAAEEKGEADDVSMYQEDIELRSAALQKYAWDEESGYFGYVVHDSDKNPVGVFKNGKGENLSKGMDGIYPLIAGICNEDQEKRILDHIFSEKEMFSKVGISAVDMSASYYQPNGYWNGNVWFSHQWFIWKTMFDLGKMEEAYRIAKTALDSWKREVDYSYYTFEMLNIATERGGWFHQFGGLSAPVNIWADAYYKPGTVTCGFDLWIHSQNYDSEKDSFHITVTNDTKRPKGLVAVTRGSCQKALLNGEEIPVSFRTDGAVEIMIPAEVERGNIILTC